MDFHFSYSLSAEGGYYGYEKLGYQPQAHKKALKIWSKHYLPPLLKKIKREKGLRNAHRGDAQMTLISISTNVDVDIELDEVLSEISDEDLIDEIKRRKTLTYSPLNICTEELMKSSHCWNRKDTSNALYHLEKALGDSFSGLKNILEMARA